jgi:hypothetical protein
MLSGCLRQHQSRDEALAGPKGIQPLTEEERKNAEKAKDPEFSKDVETVTNATPREDPIFNCLWDFAGGAMHEQLGVKGKAAEVYEKCVANCGSAARGAQSAVAEKYRAKCAGKSEATAAEHFLPQVRAAVELLEKTTKPDHMQAQAVVALRRIEEGEKGLGKDNAELAELKARVQAFIKSHRAEIEKAQTFNDRPDIIKRREEIALLKTQNQNLLRSYDHEPPPTIRDRIRLNDMRIETLDAEIDKAATAAGIR